MLLARSSVHERALVSTHFPFNKNDACFDRIVTTVRLLLEPTRAACSRSKQADAVARFFPKTACAVLSEIRSPRR